MITPINPSEAQLDALAEYLRANFSVVKSQKSGKYYVTLSKPAQNAEFGGLSARIDFCAMGLADAEAKHASRVANVTESVNKLSAEEKAALLDALTK